VDRVGTLDDALIEAKRRAGLEPDAPVRIVEYPKRRWLKLPGFLSPLRVAGSTIDRSGASSAAPEVSLEARALQSILDAPGRPLVIMPAPALPGEPEPAR